MKYKKYIFGINSYYQAVQTIKYCQNKKIFPIIFIKYFILKRLGLEWVKEFKNLLDNKFSKNTFDLYIDCKKNYGLFLHLVDQKIKYLKIENNQKNLYKLRQIAKKNSILLNPKFSILDLSKIKKIELKIEKNLF